jgi:hypothetical protein
MPDILYPGYIDILLYSFPIHGRSYHTNSTYLAREQAVDILQLKSLSLREEEEDDRYPEGVEHSEEDVRAPPNIADRRGVICTMICLSGRELSHKASHSRNYSLRPSRPRNRAVASAEELFRT